MAKNAQFSNTALAIEANALATALNNGTLEISDDIQPATSNDPVTTQTLGATITLSNPAFTVSNGTLTATNLTTTATASITPTWFRFKTSTGESILDGSIGLTNANLILDSFTTGSTINISTISIDILASRAGA